MNNLPEASRLCNALGQRAELHAVQIQLEVLGLMARLTVRQTWHNPQDLAWSGRWHFPLGAEQTLLAASSDSGQDLGAVQRDSRSLCSVAVDVPARASLSLQWRCAQLLSLQGGSLRIQLPAALAPAAQQPLRLQVELSEPVARGTVSSAHPGWQRVRHQHGMTLSLLSAQGLTQDLGLAIHGLREQGFALASPDPAAPGQCAVLASHALALRQRADEHSALRVKLVVDHSSAMPAERLAALGSAFDRLLAACGPDDQFSYSHFGAHAVHALPRLQAGTEAYLRRLRALLRRAEGGGEPGQPEAALQAVLAIPDEDEEPVREADILLLSASPLWRPAPLQRALQAQGHRLHVLAVGPTAAHSLWRELAEASGGRCEVLAPGQHAQQALERLIAHLRSQFPLQAGLQLDGAQALAPSPAPSRWADGQTLHLWAQAQPEPALQDLSGCPALRATLHWARADLAGSLAPVEGTLSPTPVLWDAQGDLARLHAAQAQAHDEDAARRLHGPALALPVVELSPLCEGPAQAPAAAPRAMPAATAAASRPAPPVAAQAAPAPRVPTRPKVLPMAPAPRAAAPAPRPALVRQGDLSHWLVHTEAAGNPLTALVQAFNAHAGAYASFRAALASTLHDVPTRALDGLVLQLSRTAGSPARVWALLLHWLHAEHGLPLAPAALALVEQELASLPVALRTQIGMAFASAAQRPRAAA